MSKPLTIGSRVLHRTNDPTVRDRGAGVLQEIRMQKTPESKGLALVLFDGDSAPRLVLLCDLVPDEKLSDQVGRLASLLAHTEVLLPEHVTALVEFHQRILPHLQVFAADCEFAERQKGGPTAGALAAAAAMRLYRRLGQSTPEPAVAIDVEAVLAGHAAPMIDLDRFRRPPVGDAS